MSVNTGEALAGFRCLGHPAVRATHAKTLEFSFADDITTRATCVLGVGARWEKPPAGPIAGPVRLRLDADGEQVLVHAVANPGWQPGQGAVIRRSGNRLPDTLATDADLGAADLPREFIDRLRDPARELRVTIERARGRPTLVLLALADRPERLPRLLAECAAADVILAEDTPSRAIVHERGFAPHAVPADRRAAGRGAAARRADRHATPPDVSAAAANAVASGGRALVISSGESPGACVADLLAPPGRLRVEVVGLPPSLTAAAASPSRAPTLMLDAAEPRRLRRLVREAPRDVRLVFRARAADLPALCQAAREGRPVDAFTVVRDSPPHAERALRQSPEQIAESLPAREPVVCCLDAAPQADGADEADGGVRQLVAALAGAGTPARTLAAALAQVPGWTRNRAYEFVTSIPARPDQEL